MWRRGVGGLVLGVFLALLIPAGVAAETTGDLSFSDQFQEGPGQNQVTLVLQNTAAAGGHTISDYIFTLDQSGVTVVSVSGGGNCTPQGTKAIMCGNALSPGQKQTDVITMNSPVTPNSGATLSMNDDSEATQPTVDVAGPTAPAAPDLVVSLSNPDTILVGRKYWEFSVTVTNKGNAPSAATHLATGFGPTSTEPSRDYKLFSFAGQADHGRLSLEVPALTPHDHHTFDLYAEIDVDDDVWEAASTGAIPLFAAIPTDADGHDGEDVATRITHVVFLAHTTANPVCGGGAADLAGIAASSCPASSVHGFSGRATGKLSAVQIAVERIAAGAHAASGSPCAEMTGSGGGFKSVPATHGFCLTVKWLNATGTSRWKFALHGKLSAGHYALYVRPVTRLGSPVAGFNVKSKNQVRFTLT